MCSELDNESSSTTRPSESEEKHIAVEPGLANDTMSESEDDDIGSEELMCNENIDVNDKDSDDSDEEELTNRVFPQQKFSPVPFAVRRSQTPDIGKVRYSPIAFPTKRAVTPNMYEQMIGKGHSHELSDVASSKAHSTVVDFGFREPKGVPHSNRSNEKSEGATSLSGQFVRPKLPTSKSHSPGLTVSGHFRPTGSVFRPRQSPFNSTSSKLPPASPESGSKVIISSADSSFSQPATFPSNMTKFSPTVNISSASSLTSNSSLAFQVKSPVVPGFRGSNHGSRLAEGGTVSQIAFQHSKHATQSNSGIEEHGPLTTASSLSNTSTHPVANQAACPTASVPTSLSPLTVSVATHSIAPFQQPVRSSPVLSPGGTKGGHLKPIAPLLSPPLMATSPGGLNSGERLLLAKKPAPLSGLMAGQGFPSHGGVGYYNANPVALNTNQGNVTSLLQSPTKAMQGPSTRPAHTSPRPVPLSPRASAPNSGNMLPYSNTERVAASAAPLQNASHTGSPITNRQPMKSEVTTVHLPREQVIACPVDAQATQNVGSDSKGQMNSKTILKRYIADGMEE